MAYIGNPPPTGFSATSKQSFSGDASTVAFTLTKAVALATDLEVFVDNVQQEPTTAYTVSSTTLTFTAAPATGTNNIYVVHRNGHADNGLLPPQDLGTTDYIFGDDVSFNSDGAVINMGADSEIKITHVADTGIKLTDSGGTPTLQFHDANESVSSDGSKLILTSNGVAFSLPTADGSSGQALTTNASGVLSFATVSSTLTGIDDQSSSNDDQLTIKDSEVVINEDSDDLDFRVESNGKDAMIFVDAGNNRLQIGSSTTDDDQMFQLIQTSGSAGFGIHTNRAAAGGSALILSKSRNASVGSFTIVQDNDSLGRITFQGDDGGDIKTEAAEISAEIDGTPGTNDMPCRIAFKTTADGANSTTERCEIDPTGAFHLGRGTQATDASGVSLMPNAQSQFVTMGNDVKVMAIGSGNDVQLTVIEFLSGGDVRGSIGVTISATSFNTSSDVRLKENIEDAKSSGSIIDQIQVREFDWKTGEHQRHGMIAQELNEVAPEAVTTDEVHKGDMWTVDYSKLVPMMMKEIQDLRKRVKELEDK